MMHFTDAQIEASVSCDEAFDAIREVYKERACGRIALQPRRRIAVGRNKFSTMAAMLDREQVAAIKFYATLSERFHFHVALVSLVDGRLIAMMDGDALTRLRTAATTTFAATLFANPRSQTLGLIGAGVQAAAHVRALIRAFLLERVTIYDPNDEIVARLLTSLGADGIEARTATAEEAARSDIVVAATRSSTPVLSGDWLLPGTFIASVGATRTDQRELDDACIARASRVIVDAREQTIEESGDFQLLAPELLARARIDDLSEALTSPGFNPTAGPVVYKAVGNALQDAALAALVYKKLRSRESEVE
ncbi:ornithine cyclodeaminase family protein [Caballeronia sp. GAFFF2]|uniref:ornithine cyclodeaminase family protein n=1 Tax=Caballeronia sp. GAFFF2 TaxID=2921741 RepID=UPI002027C6BA|nr:ornithine cyclodeaminase family protein [Caballeronia sp. GAFFF2]